MTLYEINTQLENLLMLADGNAVDQESGELFTPEAIDALEMAKEEKIEHCLLFVKNQEAEAKALKEEAEKLLARAKACENHADRTKSYVQYTLAGEKFKTSKVVVSYRKTKSVEVSCSVEVLPDDYKRIKTTVEANKVALKKALEAGEVIKGVALVEKQSMSIK